MSVVAALGGKLLIVRPHARTKGCSAFAENTDMAGGQSRSGQMGKSGRKSRGGATVFDVARLAGVSGMTVSRVMNGSEDVRLETIHAVLRAAAELSYVPNAAARSLARAQPFYVGLLYSTASPWALESFLSCLITECHRVNVRLVVEAHDPNFKVPLQATANRLMHYDLHGVILAPPLAEFSELLTAFTAAKIPVVSIATTRQQRNCAEVRIDELESAAAMTRRIIALGHRRIGFIKGDPNCTVSAYRYNGYITALRDLALDGDNATIEQGYSTYRSGIEAAERMLARRDRPTAVLCCNDEMAAATILVAYRCGFEVPRDLSVAGFGDTHIATSVWPELTTVRQPVAKMAEVSLGLLLNGRGHRNSLDDSVESRVLPFDIIERASLAPPGQ
jgi:LacI family transcriptional regulator